MTPVCETGLGEDGAQLPSYLSSLHVLTHASSTKAPPSNNVCGPQFQPHFPIASAILADAAFLNTPNQQQLQQPQSPASKEFAYKQASEAALAAVSMPHMGAVPSRVHSWQEFAWADAAEAVSMDMTSIHLASTDDTDYYLDTHEDVLQEVGPPASQALKARKPPREKKRPRIPRNSHNLYNPLKLPQVKPKGAPCQRGSFITHNEFVEVYKELSLEFGMPCPYLPAPPPVELDSGAANQAAQKATLCLAWISCDDCNKWREEDPGKVEQHKGLGSYWSCARCSEPCDGCNMPDCRCDDLDWQQGYVYCGRAKVPPDFIREHRYRNPRIGGGVGKPYVVYMSTCPVCRASITSIDRTEKLETWLGRHRHHELWAGLTVKDFTFQIDQEISRMYCSCWLRNHHDCKMPACLPDPPFALAKRHRASMDLDEAGALDGDAGGGAVADWAPTGCAEDTWATLPGQQPMAQGICPRDLAPGEAGVGPAQECLPLKACGQSVCLGHAGGYEPLPATGAVPCSSPAAVHAIEQSPALGPLGSEAQGQVPGALLRLTSSPHVQMQQTPGASSAPPKFHLSNPIDPTMARTTAAQCPLVSAQPGEAGPAPCANAADQPAMERSPAGQEGAPAAGKQGGAALAESEACLLAAAVAAWSEVMEANAGAEDAGAPLGGGPADRRPTLKLKLRRSGAGEGAAQQSRGGGGQDCPPQAVGGRGAVPQEAQVGVKQEKGGLLVPAVEGWEGVGECWDAGAGIRPQADAGSVPIELNEESKQLPCLAHQSSQGDSGKSQTTHQPELDSPTATPARIQALARYARKSRQHRPPAHSLPNPKPAADYSIPQTHNTDIVGGPIYAPYEPENLHLFSQFECRLHLPPFPNFRQVFPKGSTASDCNIVTRPPSPHGPHPQWVDQLAGRCADLGPDTACFTWGDGRAVWNTRVAPDNGRVGGYEAGRGKVVQGRVKGLLTGRKRRRLDKLQKMLLMGSTQPMLRTTESKQQVRKEGGGQQVRDTSKDAGAASSREEELVAQQKASQLVAALNDEVAGSKSPSRVGTSNADKQEEGKERVATQKGGHGHEATQGHLNAHGDAHITPSTHCGDGGASNADHAPGHTGACTLDSSHGASQAPAPKILVPGKRMPILKVQASPVKAVKPARQGAHAEIHEIHITSHKTRAEQKVPERQQPKLQCGIAMSPAQQKQAALATYRAEQGAAQEQQQLAHTFAERAVVNPHTDPGRTNLRRTQHYTQLPQQQQQQHPGVYQQQLNQQTHGNTAYPQCQHYKQQAVPTHNPHSQPSHPAHPTPPHYAAPTLTNPLPYTASALHQPHGAHMPLRGHAGQATYPSFAGQNAGWATQTPSAVPSAPGSQQRHTSARAVGEPGGLTRPFDLQPLPGMLPSERPPLAELHNVQQQQHWTGSGPSGSGQGLRQVGLQPEVGGMRRGALGQFSRDSTGKHYAGFQHLQRKSIGLAVASDKVQGLLDSRGQGTWEQGGPMARVQALPQDRRMRAAQFPPEQSQGSLSLYDSQLMPTGNGAHAQPSIHPSMQSDFYHWQGHSTPYQLPEQTHYYPRTPDASAAMHAYTSSTTEPVWGNRNTWASYEQAPTRSYPAYAGAGLRANMPQQIGMARHNMGEWAHRAHGHADQQQQGTLSHMQASGAQPPDGTASAAGPPQYTGGGGAYQQQAQHGNVGASAQGGYRPTTLKMGADAQMCPTQVASTHQQQLLPIQQQGSLAADVDQAQGQPSDSDVVVLESEQLGTSSPTTCNHTLPRPAPILVSTPSLSVGDGQSPSPLPTPSVRRSRRAFGSPVLGAKRKPKKHFDVNRNKVVVTEGRCRMYSPRGRSVTPMGQQSEQPIGKRQVSMPPVQSYQQHEGGTATYPDETLSSPGQVPDLEGVGFMAGQQADLTKAASGVGVGVSMSMAPQASVLSKFRQVAEKASQQAQAQGAVQPGWQSLDDVGGVSDRAELPKQQPLVQRGSMRAPHQTAAIGSRQDKSSKEGPLRFKSRPPIPGSSSPPQDFVRQVQGRRTARVARTEALHAPDAHESYLLGQSGHQVPLYGSFMKVLQKQQASNPTPTAGQQLLLYFVSLLQALEPKMPDQEAIWAAQAMVRLQRQQVHEHKLRSSFQDTLSRFFGRSTLHSRVVMAAYQLEAEAKGLAQAPSWEGCLKGLPDLVEEPLSLLADAVPGNSQEASDPKQSGDLYGGLRRLLKSSRVEASLAPGSRVPAADAEVPLLLSRGLKVSEGGRKLVGSRSDLPGMDSWEGPSTPRTQLGGRKQTGGASPFARHKGASLDVHDMLANLVEADWQASNKPLKHALNRSASGSGAGRRHPPTTDMYPLHHSSSAPIPPFNEVDVGAPAEREAARRRVLLKVGSNATLHGQREDTHRAKRKKKDKKKHKHRRREEGKQARQQPTAHVRSDHVSLPIPVPGNTAGVAPGWQGARPRLVAMPSMPLDISPMVAAKNFLSAQETGGVQAPPGMLGLPLNVPSLRSERQALEAALAGGVHAAGSSAMPPPGLFGGGVSSLHEINMLLAIAQGQQGIAAHTGQMDPTAFPHNTLPDKAAGLGGCMYEFKWPNVPLAYTPHVPACGIGVSTRASSMSPISVTSGASLLTQQVRSQQPRPPKRKGHKRQAVRVGLAMKAVRVHSQSTFINRLPGPFLPPEQLTTVALSRLRRLTFTMADYLSEPCSWCSSSDDLSSCIESGSQVSSAEELAQHLPEGHVAVGERDQSVWLRHHVLHATHATDQGESDDEVQVRVGGVQLARQGSLGQRAASSCDLSMEGLVVADEYLGGAALLAVGQLAESHEQREGDRTQCRGLGRQGEALKQLDIAVGLGTRQDGSVQQADLSGCSHEQQDLEHIVQVPPEVATEADTTPQPPPEYISPAAGAPAANHHGLQSLGSLSVCSEDGDVMLADLHRSTPSKQAQQLQVQDAELGTVHGLSDGKGHGTSQAASLQGSEGVDGAQCTPNEVEGGSQDVVLVEVQEGDSVVSRGNSMRVGMAAGGQLSETCIMESSQATALQAGSTLVAQAKDEQHVVMGQEQGAGVYVPVALEAKQVVAASARASDGIQAGSESARAPQVHTQCYMDAGASAVVAPAAKQATVPTLTVSGDACIVSRGATPPPSERAADRLPVNKESTSADWPPSKVEPMERPLSSVATSLTLAAPHAFCKVPTVLGEVVPRGHGGLEGTQQAPCKAAGWGESKPYGGAADEVDDEENNPRGSYNVGSGAVVNELDNAVAEGSAQAQTTPLSQVFYSQGDQAVLVAGGAPAAVPSEKLPSPGSGCINGDGMEAEGEHVGPGIQNGAATQGEGAVALLSPCALGKLKDGKQFATAPQKVQWWIEKAADGVQEAQNSTHGAAKAVTSECGVSQIPAQIGASPEVATSKLELAELGDESPVLGRRANADMQLGGGEQSFSISDCAMESDEEDDSAQAGSQATIVLD